MPLLYLDKKARLEDKKVFKGLQLGKKSRNFENMD